MHLTDALGVLKNDQPKGLENLIVDIFDMVPKDAFYPLHMILPTSNHNSFSDLV